MRRSTRRPPRRAEVDRLRARAEQLAAAIDSTDLDEGVRRIMDRVRDVLSGSQGIEHTRAVIRSIWPEIVVHHDGDRIRVETGAVSEGFATALSSTARRDGLPMLSVVEPA